MEVLLLAVSNIFGMLSKAGCYWRDMTCVAHDTQRRKKTSISTTIETQQ